MKGIPQWRYFFLTSLIGLNSQLVSAREKLELWPYIDNAAIQDQSDRKKEGTSYLIGGVVSIGLPFITTSSGSALREIGTYALVPAGIYSVIYGTYAILTDSPWMIFKKKIERLSGPEEDSVQWRLRREIHSRQVLMERADSTRFWRYFWGSIEGAAGIILIASNQSTHGIIASGVLFGLSAYHLFHKKAEEHLVEQLDRTTFSLNSGGDFSFAFQIDF